MPKLATVRPAGFSEAEWQVRCDLAACYRAYVEYGWTDLLYTHASARHPEDASLYLINPFGLSFDEVKASNLLLLDMDGNVVRGDHPCNKDGHAIHSAVLSARPDVNWVLHTHTRAGMAVSCMDSGLLPITQHAMMLHDHVSLHPWDVQTAPGECERLAADLGPRNHAMILQNHGLLACAPTIGEAFTTLYLLETACEVQAAVTSGAKLVIAAEDAIARTAERGKPGALDGRHEWDAVVRALDRADPSYRS